MRTGTALLALAASLLGAHLAQAKPALPPDLPLPPDPGSEVLVPLGGPEQTVVPGVPLQPDWWRAFASDKLDALVAAALAHATDIAGAEAALRQAQELAKAAGGAEGPQVDASYEAERARVSQALSPPLANSNAYAYTLHTAQVSLTMPLDVFGAGRARVRSARAAAEAARWRLEAARTAVAANLVQAVIQHGALNAQIVAAREAVAADRQVLDFTVRRRDLGDMGDADVASAETTLASAEAALPPLQRQLAHQRALIATLIGSSAGGAVPAIPELGELSLPARVPVSLPAAVIAQRPDVRAADAQVRGAAADLGAAAAARWPGIALTGNAGGSSERLSSLLASPFLFFTLAGAVTQPLFHSGQLLHQKRAAGAALAAAQAQYRAVALQALLDIDDALGAVRSDSAALDSATRTADAARRTLGYARRQTELGAIGTFTLAGVAATAAQAEGAVVQARSARLSDTVALYVASGSGASR